MKRNEVYELVDKERTRQQELWNPPHLWGEGDCSNPNLDPRVKLAVLTEEVGEVARNLLEHQPVLTELIQVAAVAIAWAESELT